MIMTYQYKIFRLLSNFLVSFKVINGISIVSLTSGLGLYNISIGLICELLKIFPLSYLFY